MLQGYSTKAKLPSALQAYSTEAKRLTAVHFLGILHQKFITEYSRTLPEHLAEFSSVRSHFSFNMIKQVPTKIPGTLFYLK